MSEITVSVYEDQKAILDRVLAKTSDYNWLWDACRSSKDMVKTYSELRSEVNTDKPYFIGRLSTGIRFAGDARDFPSALHALNPEANSALIKQLIHHVPSSGCDMIDVGANIGVVSASVASHIGEKGQVFAFEPSPSTHILAAATFALNEIENVMLIKSAVSGQKGISKFFDTPGNSGISSLVNHGFKFLSDMNEIEVPTCTIDDFFYGKKLNVGILKIDVEGSEIDVIEGASCFISESLPIVVYEYTPVAARSHGWSDIDSINALNRCGKFDFYAISEDLEEGFFSFPLPSDFMQQVNVFSLPCTASSFVPGFASIRPSGKS